MQSPKKRSAVRWLIVLLAIPLIIAGAIWILLMPPRVEKFIYDFSVENTKVYRGYPLVSEEAQANFLERNKHKSAMDQAFYLNPIQADREKFDALKSFLSNNSNYEPVDVQRDCGFHADLLLELNGDSGARQVLVCSSCGSIWVGNQTSERSFLDIKVDRVPELKRRVFDILGKPAEWPPELKN